jgi:hypothetical protein
MPAKKATHTEEGLRPTYQGKRHRRWPLRVLVGVLSVAGLLGLWQFIAHEPAATKHAAPTLQSTEDQLQLGAPVDAGRQGNFAPFPSTSSGSS